jgi:Putative peptidoglycan binding domain
MRQNLLVCIGSVALALTASAQTPYYQTHRKVPQRTTTYSGYRGASAVRETAPQRTFSTARFRQPAYSSARFGNPAFRTTRMQPRMNSSFEHRPAMTTNTAAWRRTLPPVTNDWRESRFNARPRPSDSFANKSVTSDVAARRQGYLPLRNNWGESDFRERPRLSSSSVNRSLGSNTVARPAARRPFRNWADSNFRERSSSFVNRSRSTAFWSGRRAAVTNNWRGEAFAGRQYSAFRDYHSQWHDSGWWRDHCGDRIVFVTVYSQAFPFYFDAGYWYPAWGYYPDAYYPYDGPIYGYNDLSPDQVIANVQTQLYNEGYYSGPIDGILGPDTRAAIADYQADHGLAVTAAIDEPTVESLGLG